MSAWAVSHIPPILMLAGLIALITGGALMLQMLFRRRFPLWLR